MKNMGLNKNGVNKKDTNNIVSKGKTFVKSIALAGLISNGVNNTNSSEIVNDLVIDTGVKYANVDIHNIKGDYLLSGYTDETGKVTIAKINIVNALQQNGFNYTDIGLNDVILNVSVNTDPGGYGSSMNIELLSDYGTLSSAGRIRDLNNSVINNTTTLVEKLVYGEWYGNIREFLGDFWYHNNRSIDLNLSSDIQELTRFVNKSISRVVSGLDQTYTLTDTNADGIVNRADIYNGVQEKLKQIMQDTGYSEGIKYGDYENMFLKERSIKRNSNFVITYLRLVGGVVVVRLDGITEGSYVEFSDKSDFSNKYDAYPDDDLYLYEGYIMHIRERFSDNTLGKVNTLKVVGNNVYRDDKVIATITNEGTIAETLGATSGVGTITGNGTTTDTGNTGGTNTGTGGTTSDTGNNTGGSTGGGSEMSNENGSVTDTGSTGNPVAKEDSGIMSLNNLTTQESDLLVNLNIIRQLEKDIEDLQIKIATSLNSVELTTLKTELEQLNQKLATSKQTTTNNYNSLNNNTKVLLEPTTTTTQKQQAVDLIVTNGISPIIIPNKTYETLPSNTQINNSVTLLQNKITALRNEVANLKTQRDLKYTQYQTYYNEYLQNQSIYNQYISDRNSYQSILQQYDAIYNPIKNLGIIPNIYLNVGSIINNYKSVQTAINEVNTRFSQYAFPSSTSYVLDTTTKGRITTGDITIINMLGITSSVKVTYGSNFSFPATLETKYNGVSLGSISVKNSQHVLDLTNYYKKYSEKTIVLGELNKLLPIEKQKNNLAAKILDNTGNYILIDILGVDYYKIYEDAYLQAQSTYNTANSSLVSKTNLLTSYENQLKGYGVNLDDIYNTNNQINDKTTYLKAIEVSNTDDIIVASGLFMDIGSLNKSLSIPVNKPLPEYAVNQLTYYVNGGSETSSTFKQYPFISYARYNISGTNEDYPAEVWVDYDTPSTTTYDSNGNKIYAKLYGGKVNNKVEKKHKFDQLHRDAKRLIDNDNLYITNLCFKYANEKYSSTGVGSTSDVGTLKANYISQCMKNQNLIEEYWTRDTMIETASELGKFGLEISGLQTIGKAWGDVITFWYGYITDNSYLTIEAKKQLNLDLLAVGAELNPIKKYNKFKAFTTRLGREYMNLSFLSKNGFGYRFKNEVKKIQQHIIGNQNFKSTNSYFNTSNLDDVINIHKEAMDMVPLDKFNDIKGINRSSYILDMGRNIGFTPENGAGIPTSKIRIIVTSDGAVHGFPVLQNMPTGVYTN